MQKILFPTDFSAHAKNALKYAMEIAKKLKAKIDPIHIYSVAFSDVAPLPYDYMRSLMDAKQAEIDDLFESLLKEYDPTYIGNSRAVYGVFPAVEIVEYAKKENYDYIIMGTRGRTNQIDQLIGSITSSVVMNAACPVIAIPESTRFEEIYSIALAASFEDKNQDTIERLQVFADQVKAGIHLVHVNTKTDKESIQEVMEDENLDNAFARFTIVHNPSVVKGLDDVIEKYAIDMLALYIPNRRLWERIFHQSISKKMALQTKIPLIVYH
ncbi:MAG: nucleotide-binding universal stress UspA family protein [Saprospiraceae bacterium]|jgi:nucleotide-binding universal stress UspA family protein